MAIPAIDIDPTADMGRLVVQAVKALRDARESVLRAWAAVDQTRDGGAISARTATELGAPDTTEAGKLFDELSSLRGYVASTDANTLGVAVLQICAKLGV